MKPRVAKRNIPAVRKLLPLETPLPELIVATSTIDPRLPSIGIAFIATPAAPSLGCSCGGGIQHDLAAGHLRLVGARTS